MPREDPAWLSGPVLVVGITEDHARQAVDALQHRALRVDRWHWQPVASSGVLIVRITKDVGLGNHPHDVREKFLAVIGQLGIEPRPFLALNIDRHQLTTRAEWDQLPESEQQRLRHDNRSPSQHEETIRRLADRIPTRNVNGELRVRVIKNGDWQTVADAGPELRKRLRKENTGPGRWLLYTALLEKAGLPVPEPEPKSEPAEPSSDAQRSEEPVPEAARAVRGGVDRLSSWRLRRLGQGSRIPRR